MKFAIVLLNPPQGNHHCLDEMGQMVYYGLQALGYDCIEMGVDKLTEYPPDDRQYIVLGANANPLYETPFLLPRNTIIYNFEQIYRNSPWLKAGYIDYLYQYPLWDYSLGNIAKLKELGIHHVAHVPVGYVPELTQIPPGQNQDIDVLFYGSINDRRQFILDELEKQGVRVKTLFGVYGSERDAYIARSKIVLNLHFYEAKVFEIVRVSYLWANQVFVISETGSYPAEEAFFAEGLVFSEYTNLVETCLTYLKQDQERSRIAQRGFELMQSCAATNFLSQGIQALPKLRQTQNPSAPFIKDFFRKSLARHYFEQEEYAQAIDLYEETLQVDPYCLSSYWELGVILLYTGDELAGQLLWSSGL